MKLIFISGPFRAPNSWEIEKNIRRAEALALEVWKLGAAVICPHANTRFFQGAAEDDLWLKGDLEMLRRCDAVMLTDTWRGSAGAKTEVAEAQHRQIPVFERLGDLWEWLEENN